MFLVGFVKTAATLVTMTPEEYYDVVREKDPFVGATVGAVLGGLAGARKGTKKSGKSRSALAGAVAGGALGAVNAHLLGKAVRRHQAKKVRRMAEELNLKATPGRKV